MYLVAIGYAYVILLVALTSRNTLTGIAIALFLGVLPLWILFRSMPRRRHPGLGQGARQPDGTDPQGDE